MKILFDTVHMDPPVNPSPTVKDASEKHNYFSNID